MRPLLRVGAAHRHGSSGVFLVTVLFLVLSTYIEQVVCLPAELSANTWPTFNKRNIAALARDGYIKSAAGFKRSISTLAKNGQLPTFRSPYDEVDKQEDEDESHEKRNIAAIARLRSFAAMKRNIQALARDGYRGGRNGQYNQQYDKRNIQALARNGLIHKRENGIDEEYYYPFYQNPIPPLSELDQPFDYNELYDFQQSINPDMFPPLSQFYKRNDYIQHDYEPSFDHYSPMLTDYQDYYKRGGSNGSPVLGIYRQSNDANVRSKRYLLPLPDVMEHNDIQQSDNSDVENHDKRSVGSIPLTRISELGNISLVPKLNQQRIQTTPTYRRRQYLLTRTRQDASSTDR